MLGKIEGSTRRGLQRMRWLDGIIDAMGMDLGVLWVLVKTLESPLDYKEIQPVHPKGDQLVFTGRTDAEAETPIL